MALTAAERARKYRIKRNSDPVKRAEYLENEKNRWHINVASGKVKTVATMTDTEHSKAKNMWKGKMSRYRRKKEDSALLTPPASPHQEANDAPVGDPSQQYKQAAEKMKRNGAKCYRQIAQLEQSLKRQKTLTEKYKKQSQRSAAKHQKSEPQTPINKTRHLLRYLCTSPSCKNTKLSPRIHGQFKRVLP